jgi:hypothetical protein
MTLLHMMSPPTCKHFALQARKPCFGCAQLLASHIVAASCLQPRGPARLGYHGTRSSNPHGSSCCGKCMCSSAGECGSHPAQTQHTLRVIFQARCDVPGRHSTLTIMHVTCCCCLIRVCALSTICCGCVQGGLPCGGMVQHGPGCQHGRCSVQHLPEHAGAMP